MRKPSGERCRVALASDPAVRSRVRVRSKRPLQSGKTSTQGSSSGRSSAGGSGNSSPQREPVDDVADEVVQELVPPAPPLVGQPSNDELDMWEVLMNLDGARAHAKACPARSLGERTPPCASERIGAK